MPEARKCAMYWKEELAKLDYSRCKAIVILGEFALKAITNDGHAKISEARLRKVDPSRVVESIVETVEGATSDDLEPGNTTTAGSIENPLRFVPESVLITGTYHPSAALPHHDSGKYDEIVADLENIWKIRDPIRPVTLLQYAKELSRSFKDKPDILSLDLEWKTTGELRMAGISDSKSNIVVKDVKSVIDWIDTP